jgi:hypothetical protein
VIKAAIRAPGGNATVVVEKSSKLPRNAQLTSGARRSLDSDVRAAAGNPTGLSRIGRSWM